MLASFRDCAIMHKVPYAWCGLHALAAKVILPYLSTLRTAPLAAHRQMEVKDLDSGRESISRYKFCWNFTLLVATRSVLISAPLLALKDFS